MGHLLRYDFDDAHREWRSCEPVALFDARVVSAVTDKLKNVADNLTKESRTAQMLMIWTDCDREGENIGAEVMDVCRRAKPTITVKRARFSAIIAQYVSSFVSSRSTR